MQKDMRLIAFGFRSLHDVDGGIETHARELYSRLAGLGFDVLVLGRSPYERKHVQRPAHRQVANLTEKSLYAPMIRGLEAMMHSALAAAYCIVARPQVVHVHGIGPALFVPLMRLSGLRVIMTHHGQDYLATKWGLFARGVLRVGEYAGVRTASGVICVSNYIREQIRAKYAVAGHTIYNGLPAQRSAPKPVAEPLAGLEPGRYVLMVGRLTPHKRVEDVIRALHGSESAGLRLVVCGAGTDSGYARWLRELAGDGCRVVFAGFVSPDDLGWVYRHALCTVMASSYEGMPLAVLEALGHGSPTYVSRIPAHEELRLPAECYFDLGDVAAIRRCIAHARKAERPVASVETALDARFSWSTIAGQTKAVLLGQPVPDHATSAVNLP